MSIVFCAGMMTENPEKYLCPSCRELMTDACQTANCRHRFCRRCLKQFFNEDPRTAKCPVSGCQVLLSGEDGIKYFPDRCFQREIRELCTIKCSLGQCKWVGAVGELEDHKTKCHPSYTVKAVESSKATHVMVDAKHMDATHSIHHHLKKLTGDIKSSLGDMCHTVEVLVEAANTQHMMDHVIRENIEAKHHTAVATQCPVSIGQPTSQEHCTTQQPFNLMMGEIVPEMDTSTLTQVDRDQYLHGQQVQAVKCTPDDQQCTGTNTQPQITASSNLRPITSTMIVDRNNTSANDQVNLIASPPKMVTQYTQTMFENHPPPLPKKTKPGRSATLPQQGTASSINCSPPRSFSVGSEATVHDVVATETDEFTCPESEMRQKELERELATEKSKSMTMQNILKEELHLGPAKGSYASQNESRKRVATVPARNLKNARK